MENENQLKKEEFITPVVMGEIEDVDQSDTEITNEVNQFKEIEIQPIPIIQVPKLNI